MGGCCIKMSAKRYSMNEEKFQKLLKICERFGLGRGLVDDLFTVYAKIDIGLTGRISLREFLEYFDLEVSAFSRRTFGVLDTDNSGDIDFFEFVVNLYSYCTYDWKGLVKYAFDLFDETGDGQLDIAEVRSLVKFLYGKTVDKKVEHIINRMDDDSSGTVSFQEFGEKARKFPLLLFPAFYMQDQMQKKCMGVGFWQKHTYRIRQSEKYGLEQGEEMLEVLKDIIFERKKAQKDGKRGAGGGKKGKKVKVKNRDGEGRNGALPTAGEVFSDLDDLEDTEAREALRKKMTAQKKAQKSSADHGKKESGKKKKAKQNSKDSRAGRHNSDKGKKVHPR